MKKIRLLQTLIISTALFFVSVVIYNEYAPDAASVPAPAFASLTEKVSSYENPLSEKTEINEILDSPGDDTNRQIISQDSSLIEMKGSIQKGDSFESSLRRLSLSANIRQQIINSFRSHLDFKRLDPKDIYTVRLTGAGNLDSCTYEADPLEVYTLEVIDGAVTVEKNSISLETKTIKIAGTIDSSLFASFARMKELPGLVYAFADIFSSKIDFNTEPQRGDKFSLIVDKYYKGDSFIGYGKIKVAQYYMSSGKEVNAYYYSNKNITGAYFDSDGKEVGTSFLRSPVPMGRVTSRFTYRRKHPITGKVQPHLGVDLAAPVGTPILAASDGKVLSIGRNGGNGRQIILSHNGGVKTYYGHLSRYKKGLKKGSTVEKKEIIGFVGSSGLSTGPHLDYRIQKNGVFKNPFSLEFTPKSELSGDELALFQKESSSMKSLLTSIPENPENIVQVKNFILEPEQKLNLL